MSIFTLNLLDWFVEAAGPRDKGTGESIALGATGPEDQVVNPRGDKFSVKSAATSFAETFYQGIYQLHLGGRKELLAINLQDPNESNLRRPTTIDLRASAGVGESASSLFAFWPYLLAAALLVLLGEWFLHPPTRRAGFERTARA
jgi:hypothetical protein